MVGASDGICAFQPTSTLPGRRSVGRSSQFALALAPPQGCPGPAPKPDRPSRCRWGLAPPERPRAFRSPRSYDQLFQPVGICGGSLGAAFHRAMVSTFKQVMRHCHATQQALKWARRMYLGALLSVSKVPVEPALERRRRTCRSWTAQHQRTAGSPAGRASARARV